MGSISSDERDAALSAARVGVWTWDARTRRVRWSPETEAIYGLSPGEFEGTFEAFEKLIYPDDLEDVRAAIKRGMSAGAEEYRSEHRIQTKNGELKVVAGRGRVILDEKGEAIGMTGTVADVSDRYFAQKQVRENSERFRLFSELASDYVYDAKVEGGLFFPTIVAGSFERTTGYTAEEVKELGGWLTLVHPDDLPSIMAHLANIEPGRPLVAEYRIRDGAGRTIWLRDRMVPFVDEETGELARFLGGVRDITEQKELEGQLRHAQKMEALAQLAGSVAHDFNNLLTVVFGAMSSLQPVEGSPPSVLDGYGHALDALHRAAELTRTLLVFGRKHVGKSRVLDLRMLAMGSIGIIERACGQKTSVDVIVSEDAGPLAVSADASQLQLVLLNLALNARDAMPAGGSFVIDLSQKDAPDGRIRLVASDDGAGMDEETLAHVFEPYFTTKGAGEGTGLGLATVHGIVNDHAGVIRAESELGVGTRFVLDLPRATAPIDSVSPVRTSPSTGGTETVLVVEDDPGVRRAIRRSLEEHGYRVDVHESAESALLLTNEELEKFSLLLSDVRLGGLDGVRLAGELHARVPELAVLLTSGYVEEEQRALLEERAYTFLPKPFTPKTLAEAVRRALDEER